MSSSAYENDDYIYHIIIPNLPQLKAEQAKGKTTVINPFVVQSFFFSSDIGACPQLFGLLARMKLKKYQVVCDTGDIAN